MTALKPVNFPILYIFQSRSLIELSFSELNHMSLTQKGPAAPSIAPLPLTGTVPVPTTSHLTRAQTKRVLDEAVQADKDIDADDISEFEEDVIAREHTITSGRKVCGIRRSILFSSFV